MASDSSYEILVSLRAEVSEIKSALGAIDGLATAMKENTSALNQSKGASKAAGDDIENLGKKVGKTNEIFLGFNLSIGDFIANQARALPGRLRESITAFGESELANAKLGAALRQTGQYSDELMDELTGLASGLQRITTVGDETVMDMQSIALAMGVGVDSVDAVTKGAIGLSKAFDMDLKTATKAAAAAIQGKTQLLTRYIPMLSECESEAAKLAMVEEKQAIGWAQARAEANTLLGQIEMLKNSFGEIAETVGGAFAPALRIAGDALGGISTAIGGMQGPVRVLTLAFANLAIMMAFNKIGGTAAIVGGFNKIKTAVVGLRSATLTLNAAMKMLTSSHAAILAVSVAVSTLVFWYDKAVQARKELTKELNEAVETELQRIATETARIRAQGLADAAQSNEQVKERIKLLEDELKVLEEREKADGALRAKSLQSGKSNDEAKAAWERRHIQEAEIENTKAIIAELKKQSAEIEKNAPALEAKNIELMTKAREAHAKAMEDANAERRAETDLAFAAELAAKKVIEAQEKLLELEDALEAETSGAKRA